MNRNKKGNMNLQVLLLRCVSGILLFLVMSHGIYSSETDEPDYVHLSKEKLSCYMEFLDRENRTDAVAYTVGKFASHEVVILGEPHRRREDAELVTDVISEALRKYDVRHIVWEFGYFRTQEQTDMLLNSPIFDEKLMMELAAQNSVYWLYKEYLEIYRTIWKLNREINDPDKRVRLINFGNTLNSVSLHCSSEQIEKDEMAKDGNMADKVCSLVKKGHKILVYCGSHHGFTRFHHPVHPDYPEVTATRGGNMIYDRIGQKVFYIHLQFASLKKRTFVDNSFEKGFLYAFNAVPMQIMEKYAEPICIDTGYPELTNVIESNSLYSIVQKQVSISDFCDGFIMLKPVMEYTRVSAVSQDLIRLVPLDYYRKLAGKDELVYKDLLMINATGGLAPENLKSYIDQPDWIN